MEYKRYEAIQNYDYPLDILYIRKDLDYEYKESIEMGNNLVLDIDINNKPVALEIIDASRFFNISKYSLKKGIKGKLSIDIKEDIICLKGVFAFLVHNKKQDKPFVQETVNDINLPLLETNFEMAEA